jgi:hypothetical protein
MGLELVTLNIVPSFKDPSRHQEKRFGSYLVVTFLIETGKENVSKASPISTSKRKELSYFPPSGCQIASFLLFYMNVTVT